MIPDKIVMSVLFFPGAAVLEPLAHAKADPEHSSRGSSNLKLGPGLLLVRLHCWMLVG